MFDQYRSSLSPVAPGKWRERQSIFHAVPIELRSEMLSYLQTIRFKCRLRYRGPRAHRTGIGRQAHCLRADATHFAVYLSP